tara:strand:+ start:17989 stop:19254 length:1266 start_codon:yes stop_codon:yes gene_type:complete
MIITKVMGRVGYYEIDEQTLYDIFYNMIDYGYNEEDDDEDDDDEDDGEVDCSEPIIVGLLTNEIPPIVYGGVATWIVNFMKMFEGHKNITVVPIYLAYNDKLPEECYDKYPNIRVINNESEIEEMFEGIDVCINNLWIALDTIIKLKEYYPDMNVISVCHSLIRMENITNLGSVYTNNFNQQELIFQNSDCVVLISKAEETYYNTFGYDLFGTKTCVIHNSYSPMFDNVEKEIDYESNDLGYIGRHVPRKRPELVIKAVDYLNNKDVKVVNMGVDYDKYDNEYWRELKKEYKDQLEIVPFSTDKDVKEKYWESVGVNCITGIYEPFGYTICESIDRGIPVIVQNIDGPKEIIDEVKEYIITYDVDWDIDKDIINFSEAVDKIWKLTPEERRDNCIKARKCLDKLRPEAIRKDWYSLIKEMV